MKKLLAIVMAGILTCSYASVSFAAEKEVVTLDESMIDQNLYEGSWVNTFDTFEMYLPNDWEIVYNFEGGEAPEDEIYFSAQSKDGTRVVAISYSEADMIDLEVLAEAFEEDEDILNSEIIEINGLPGISYLLGEGMLTTLGVSIPTEDGGVYNIVFSYSNEDEEFNEIGRNIACSIKAAEEKTEQ